MLVIGELKEYSMTHKEIASDALKKALELLESTQGKPLSLEEREKRAIHLAAEMLKEANRTMTREEKRLQRELSRMMRDSVGKAFTTSMTDQCFRSHKPSRVANQMVYLLNQMGIPRYLGLTNKASLALFQAFGQLFSWVFVPVAIGMLRKATSKVILPGEPQALKKHIAKRRLEGVRLNLNHLGEAILGEEEAKRRLNVYLEDLKRDDIEYISVKISTIFSQIHLIGWERTLDVLAERLRALYRVAMQHSFCRFDGTKAPKFVNLDMEEYRDLALTKELFMRVLSEPEFHQFSAGIVLQAYLPDSHDIQKEITEWSIKRVVKGGAPVKIRIVKGANLAMEQFEASARDWAQAPYTKKSDVDANYKKMVTYGSSQKHAKAVHLGIASHNLFDIAYALLLRAENGVHEELSFEMLEGMADHIRRVVQQLVGTILLYCPVATKQDFQSAIAYLIRRLDENTGADNFLRVTFGLTVGSPDWDDQVALFANSCKEMDTVYTHRRRKQDRNQPAEPHPLRAPFENEADTDFSLAPNRLWAQKIYAQWKHKKIDAIPLVIAGETISSKEPQGMRIDASNPEISLYRYELADSHLIDRALSCAKEREASWGRISVDERCELIATVAHKMRQKRGDLIGAMLLDGNKTILEGDPEVSEAIDFAEYYLRSMQTMAACPTLHWKAKGTVLVTPPWNFPISIPAGGILAALAAGNCVLFKPAPEAVLSGWELVQLFWEAGIPKDVLQFINCTDEPVGSSLIRDPRINCIILTGASATAELFMKLRPGLELFAETGGKNPIIVTALADRDLAIKDVVSSAFGHNGQKCSACSLLILEKEVYDDPHFLKQLKDAVESVTVGSCWDPSSKVTPLIHAPNEVLERALTTLERGESWLVKPQKDPVNPALWSPSVKLGVQKGSFSHQTEFFGPVLSVMRADDLAHAIQLANDTPYGLTSGLQSLDEREKALWMEHIEAGNCYINRGITGAIVRRQPFGGTKASSYGKGAKAGGPNYVMQFALPEEQGLPQEKAPVSDAVNALSQLIQKCNFTPDELGVWYASTSNYAFWAKRFSEDHDPSELIGQDNLLRYRPHKNLCLRICSTDKPLDWLRSLAAALSVGAPIVISRDPQGAQILRGFAGHLHMIEEDDAAFARQIEKSTYRRVRLLSPPSDELIEVASRSATFLDAAPVLSHGRIEVLHYLREIAFSIDYHRYGNLGLREGQKRKTIH